MERIRYRKVGDLGLKSVQTLAHPTNGARYNIEIFIKESKWSVIDEETSLEAASGYQKSPHKAKIEVRKALHELGIELNVGIRSKHLKV